MRSSSKGIFDFQARERRGGGLPNVLRAFSTLASWVRLIKLVKGSFLVKLCQEGNRIERRQELPKEAFWEPKEVLDKISQYKMSRKKFVIVLSYRWLSREHPDPDRHHLTTMHRIFKMAMEDIGDDIAIFWDFLSLHQVDDYPPCLRQTPPPCLCNSAAGGRLLIGTTQFRRLV